MSLRFGSGYIGSPSIETSTSNHEVIPSPPSNWTMKYSLYKFSFSNEQECHVSINGGSPIYLRAGQGFQMDIKDQPIMSFKIFEPDIAYNYMGAY
ncbi:hypothetical protein P8891_11265 [Bacillus atrophaeus]|uniref:hypothetical protein n=1 Tax=Bacillus atrophaeus TaxID=1452 RepID=UPI0022804134|nr:hypothetical protein [Bacillus atrophaeus]MCY7948992.1 hypothetical protein [Bacillus atrophaeus]MCY8097864.1 hypothetical protein [Bacillus atrophaeus]MCY9167707.1 hypothetical protein [Bacillus atrophaeus]MEC0741643.1 hypothetical protein [Bacillus atrophaeus]MEC0745042.1 hypothetical protein [Bacillus atrophaeus]